MEEKLEFVYNKEYWYVSAFINNGKIEAENKKNDVDKQKEDKVKKTGTIEDINEFTNKVNSEVKHTITHLEKKDLKQFLTEKVKDKVVDLAHNISINCKWISHIKIRGDLPYKHENIDQVFNELGSFEFEVEYYKDKPLSKHSIEPEYLQQIPTVVKDLIKEISIKTENKALYIDEESPLYILIISTETKPDNNVRWTTQEISKHKKLIGSWTELYSGVHKDYSEKLYDERIVNNLSNRESELHYLRRNSGFIYIIKDSYNQKHIREYIYDSVITTTVKIRALSFALLSIDDSLDTITASKIIEKTKKEEKILDIKSSNLDKIKPIREVIKEHMSEILNELVLNRRQHYTAVLDHLMEEFKINKTYKRISKKLKMVYDEMQEIVVKHQRRMKKSMERLNVLIIAGVIADFITFFALAFSGIGTEVSIVYLLSSLLMLSFLGYVLYKPPDTKTKKVKPKRLGAVVGIVCDKDKKVLALERAKRPFKQRYSLPGCYFEKDKDPKTKLKEEVFEEAGLKIEIEKKIGVCIYDEKWNVKTIVYRCSIRDDSPEIEVGGNAKTAELIPLEKIKHIDLAFDHEDILALDEELFET